MESNGSGSRSFVDPMVGYRAGESFSESRAWFKRARKRLAGGVTSSARAKTFGRFGFPLYIEKGKGSRIWDCDGNQYVDYFLGYGSVILGHGHPALTSAIGKHAKSGVLFGTVDTTEVELAEQICRMVPNMHSVRFANSGSEAVCAAIRVARGYTNRSMIIKFEGHYHGWTDVLAVSTRPSEKNVGPFDSPNRDVMTLGIPSAVSNDVLVLPWNDRSILTAAMNRHKDRLAAIITEPIAANNACTMPTKGFLEFLQSECQNRGIVLIFDEVCTGFRVAPGGAQGLYGVRPDLSIFSKALGGGLPISAFGGSKAIMELVASDKVRHGGTYNGNSLCTAGSLAVLRELRDKSIQFRIKSHGSLIMHSLVTSARDHEIPCVVQGIPSMFQIVFGLTKPTQQYRQLLHADAKLYTLFREALLENGVHITPSHLAYWTVSASHTNEDAETTKFAIASAMKRVSDARGK